MGKFARGAIVVAVVVAARLVYPTYTKGQMHGQVHDRFSEVCDGDARCMQAVEQHFETCFDEEWSRPSNEFDAGNMARCINDKSGEEWFELESE